MEIRWGIEDDHKGELLSRDTVRIAGEAHPLPPSPEKAPEKTSFAEETGDLSSELLRLKRLLEERDEKIAHLERHIEEMQSHRSLLKGELERLKMDIEQAKKKGWWKR
ncbi:MAG: hypothetical protein RDV48_17310 [Candidatus Eremiobacteraeota bacterium]|nr:hypothetical protein [Candidatus Eremiobacteraeota bacterium]